MTDSIKLDYTVKSVLLTSATQITEKWWVVYEDSHSTITGKICAAKEKLRCRERTVAEQQAEILRALCPKDKLLRPIMTPIEHKLKREPTNGEVLETIRVLLKDAFGIPAEKFHAVLDSVMTPKPFRRTLKLSPGPPEQMQVVHLAADAVPTAKRDVLPATLLVE